MPPKFMERDFKFEEGKEVPEHIESYAREEERDSSKIWLQGEDTFSHEYYPLAIDIDDLPTASALKAARLKYLEETQPSSSSGGQGGIQDRVYIREPETTK